MLFCFSRAQFLRVFAGVLWFFILQAVVPPILQGQTNSIQVSVTSQVPQETSLSMMLQLKKRLIAQEAQAKKQSQELAMQSNKLKTLVQKYQGLQTTLKTTQENQVNSQKALQETSGYLTKSLTDNKHLKDQIADTEKLSKVQFQALETERDQAKASAFWGYAIGGTGFVLFAVELIINLFRK